MNRIIGLVVVMMFLLGSSVGAAGVQVELNGQPVVMDDASGRAYIDPAGRVMVPLRVVAEAAGKAVSYDAVNRAAVIVDGSLTITVPIDQPYVVVNREIKANDAPARIISGRTYLPIRIVMEALGYQVRWDGGLFKVILTGTAPVAESSEAPAVPAVPNTAGSTSINLYNGGLLARENDDLVFVNFEDDERVWRINTKTGMANKVSARAGRSLNVVDGWVYYRQETLYNTWELYKVKLDGTGTKMVATGDTRWLMVESGYLYYYLNDAEALYRMKLTDLYGTKYYEKPMASISLENGWLIYVKMEEDSEGDEIPGDIMKVNIETREETRLSEERSGTDEPVAALIGGKLYYTRYNDALSLYEMDLTTGAARKVNDRWTYNISGDGTVLYTLYPDNSEGLYRLDAATGVEKKLSSEWRPGTYHDPGITVLDGKVYFIKRVGTNRYSLHCYDLTTGRLKTITEPADLLTQK